MLKRNENDLLKLGRMTLFAGVLFSTSYALADSARTSVFSKQNRFGFDRVSFTLSKEQTTHFKMNHVNLATSTFYQNLEKFEFNQILARDKEVALDATLTLGQSVVSLKKTQILPMNGSLSYQREYNRRTSGRGFALPKQQFDFFGQEALIKVIQLSDSENAEAITKKLRVDVDYHSDYKCIPNYIDGFDCYYRFKVRGIVMAEASQIEGVPHEFQLTVEATDYYHQNGRVLTGTRTKYHNFEFAKIFKKLEQVPVQDRNIAFDYLNQSITVDQSSTDIVGLEVLSGEGEAFVIDKFEYMGKDFLTGMRQELLERAQDGTFVMGLNDTMTEEYSNPNVACQRNRRRRQIDFACTEKDEFVVKMQIIPQAGH